MAQKIKKENVLAVDSFTWSLKRKRKTLVNQTENRKAFLFFCFELLILYFGIENPSVDKLSQF